MDPTSLNNHVYILMILKDKLVKLLTEFYDECPEVLDIPGTADKIIALFVDAIKNEVKISKHHHEQINSAFVFPPCKNYENREKK